MNSAHPFENPTPFSKFIEAFAMMLNTRCYNLYVRVIDRSQRAGWIIFGVMAFFWIISLTIGIDYPSLTLFSLLSRF